MAKRFDLHKSSSFKFKKMFEIARNQSSGSASELGFVAASPSEGRRGLSPQGSTKAMMPRSVKEGVDKEKAKSLALSDMELLKKKFAKLLLGEDMSGGGRGVSSALALSNAITNLAASVFSEQRKLEPMKPERKARWRKEMDWLLTVTDHIVEFIPSQQQSPDGTVMEVMVTRQRKDLLASIPELCKLDAMLMECLDNFRDQNEFWYVDPNDQDESDKNRSQRDWWIPVVKVPADGLSDISRKWIEHQKESVNQVLKAALDINAQTLSDMQIPESYIDALPRNGRAILGDSIYKSITDDYYDPAQLLGSMDLSSERKVVDLKNRIEASIVIWKRKMVHKDGKSSWGSAVSLEKRELFEERAETILLILKHNFPGIPQSSLDISKIQHNKDVGYAVLESYSRVLESVASAVMCRIDDVLQADSLAQNSSSGSNKKISLERTDSEALACSMTLMDFIGWGLDQGDDKKKMKSGELDGNKEKLMIKTSPPESKRLSYLERLENWGGVRSPTSRH